MCEGGGICLSEIRKDYFTNRIVLSSTQRNLSYISEKKRKSDWEKSENKSDCSFCPGNEYQNPPADMVLVQKQGALIKLSDEDNEHVSNWVVRVFPSKSSLVSMNPNPAYSDRPLYSEPAYGHHYILVATPNHNEGIADMSIDQLVNVLTTVQDKVRVLYSKKKVSYVAVFLNYGQESGTTQAHTHLEIMTLPRLPPRIEAESMAVQKSIYDLGVCPMCNVVNVEAGGPRQILATDFFMALAPWASSHNYEFWIFPKKHQTSFLKTSQKEIADLSLILRCTLGGMNFALNDPPFNLIFHISSEKKTTRQLHWHIEVYPQINSWGGLERGMGVFINRIPPEQVAEEFGEYSRKELARVIGIK